MNPYPYPYLDNSRLSYNGKLYATARDAWLGDDGRTRAILPARFTYNFKYSYDGLVWHTAEGLLGPTLACLTKDSLIAKETSKPPHKKHVIATALDRYPNVP